MAKRTLQASRKRRHLRLRQKVKGTPQRPRLVMNRTSKHIHAQIIDDTLGHTLASVSTVQKDVAGSIEAGKGSIAAATFVGDAIAQKAKDAGIETVVFDRNGNQYMGAVQAFAEAAREAGLEF
jgi:large subunit ribosomal protein L18